MLLESIQLNNINNQPYHDFQAKDNQIQDLQEFTLLRFESVVKCKKLWEWLKHDKENKFEAGSGNNLQKWIIWDIII